MNNYDEKIKTGRDFIDGFHVVPGEKTHQQLRLPQPPLVKGKMTDTQIPLPMNFQDLEFNRDILSIFTERISRRVYSDDSMTLLELSFLLWSTQGIKKIRGNNYSTLRTVPSAGARHGFETYFTVKNVEGLKCGGYHYLPMSNEIEYLGEIPDMDENVAQSLHGQTWGAKGNVVFYWSLIPYRIEWRYGDKSHRLALIDVGHVGQNLYMACESIGLGTCAIAAFDSDKCVKLFGLNKEEEFILYASPVGTVKPEDKEKEDAIYAFVKDEPGAQPAK